MLHKLSSPNPSDIDWLPSLWTDCKRRLVYLVGTSYMKGFTCQLALSAINNSIYKVDRKGKLTVQ